MAIPSISDLKTYVGQLINNNYWDFNFTKLVNWLTDSTADLTFQSFTVNSTSSMGNAKIINLGAPTVATDAASKGYVDNAATPMGYLYGFNVSKNSTTPTIDLDIGAGICQNSTNTQAIKNVITITKRINTAWASGTGNGLLDTGTIAANTTYYLFAIAKSDGTSDILGSASSTNPVLPTNYTVFRQIGKFSTNSSSQTNIVYTKSLIDENIFPDYAKGVSKNPSTNYTESSDGWLWVYNSSSGDVSVTIAGEVLKIGGSLGAGNVGQGGLIPIVKGSVYNVTAGVNPYTIKFYPVKGAN